MDLSIFLLFLVEIQNWEILFLCPLSQEWAMRINLNNIDKTIKSFQLDVQVQNKVKAWWLKSISFIDSFWTIQYNIDHSDRYRPSLLFQSKTESLSEKKTSLFQKGNPF